MPITTPKTALRSFLYGGAAVLLAFDVYYLAKAAVTTNFVPIVPILAGIFTAAGLLFIVYAEQRAREEDKRDHRRISRVAHQLMSPLQALAGDLSDLATNSDKLPSEARLKLKRMETKTKVLLENIRDVFYMLQAQEKNLSRERRTHNVCTLVDEVLETARPLAAARNVEIGYKAHCADAPVYVEKQLFGIALTHLVENALLYTQTPGKVSISVVRGPKQARIVIQDRGIGITTTEAKTIFQPFARGQRAEQFDTDGIGVGLTLARLIVREYDGDIRWKNREEGMGAEFEIVLPLVAKK